MFMAQLVSKLNNFRSGSKSTASNRQEEEIAPKRSPGRLMDASQAHAGVSLKQGDRPWSTITKIKN